MYRKKKKKEMSDQRRSQPLLQIKIDLETFS
jgi:hypothetical protein